MTTASIENVTSNSPDGAVIGASASDKVALYGATPVAQRATASTQVTTNVVTSASFGTLQVAQIQEIQNTLIGLGIWATV
jgi:uncharacterized protein YfaA (DUF2138 family)